MGEYKMQSGNSSDNGSVSGDHAAMVTWSVLFRVTVAIVATGVTLCIVIRKYQSSKNGYQKAT